MGLAQAQRRRQHITVDILSANFRGWLAKASLGLALIAAMLFFGYIGWAAAVLGPVFLVMTIVFFR